MAHAMRTIFSWKMARTVFFPAKPWGMRLCEELQLSDELIGTTTQYRQSFIVRDGKFVPVPQGFYLMVPGSLPPF